MDFTGKLISIAKDFSTGKWNMMLQINEDATGSFEKLKSFESLDVVLKKRRNKRSIDANSYYWQLLTKLAETMHVSKPFMHNQLLRRYGQAELFDGRCVYITIPDTESSQKQADEDEYTHLKPTSQIREGNDGIIYRTYKLLRGSHSYDTREMSVLIDGLVSECKDVGIETMTPDELNRMKEEWKKYEQKHKSTSI